MDELALEDDTVDELETDDTEDTPEETELPVLEDAEDTVETIELFEETPNELFMLDKDKATLDWATLLVSELD